MIPRSIKPNTGIKGMDIVLRNLNREIKAIEGRSMKGLINSAIIIRRDMDKTPPLIPVDTGNLRSSWFTTPFHLLGQIGIMMGFSANYALWVHEMLGMNPKEGWRYGPGPNKKRWFTPRRGAGPKFFEASIKRNKDKILQTIRDNAKIKP